MADKANKFPENVPGPFYVDDQCTFCQLCIQMAPECFKEADGHAVVAKQPGTDQEKSACQQALDSCPAQAIGSDGE
jgi:ferredoxin